MASKNVPGVGLMSALDLGEADDIHPKAKKPVGERLANWALSEVYGHRDVPWRPPQLAMAERRRNVFRARVEDAGEGLRTNDGAAPRGFQVAGEGRRWRWVTARLVDSASLEVFCAGLYAPVALRYAWQANPDANIVGSNGPPLLPFRTDDRPLTML